MVDVPSAFFITWISMTERDIVYIDQVIHCDLGEGLQISGEFISYLNSEQANECMDYTRLFYGRMKRWFPL